MSNQAARRAFLGERAQERLDAAIQVPAADKENAKGTAGGGHFVPSRVLGAEPTEVIRIWLATLSAGKTTCHSTESLEGSEKSAATEWLISEFVP